MSWLLKSGGIFLCAASAACYAYVPSRASSSARGEQVELRLTDSGSVILASRIGAQIEQVRGRLSGESPAALSVAIDETQSRDGITSAWRHELVEVPRPLIASIGVRTFSPSRTALFSAISATALIAVERGFLRPGGANAPGPSPSGTPTSR